MPSLLGFVVTAFPDVVHAAVTVAVAAFSTSRAASPLDAVSAHGTYVMSMHQEQLNKKAQRAHEAEQTGDGTRDEQRKTP